MKYSFILIAFNEENTIIACIKSILRQELLGTSYEILVVDDGSTDSTAELVLDFSRSHKQVRLIGDGQNHGRGYGRHTGVNASTGEFVIMVDADIMLPKSWLITTLPFMRDYDVAGGIAVPDGDVAYIYRQFRLKPKTVRGTTTITGNNGVYKRDVFTKLNFDPNLREGEDVDFNNRALVLGVREYCVPGLSVEHQEHKSFPRSMLWLYQSGIGATRQLLRFKEIRLPDLAFAATVITFVAATVLCLIIGGTIWFVVPLLGLLGASTLHLRGKFYLSAKQVIAGLGAILTDALLIACYYVGRLMGFLVFAKHQLATKQQTAGDTSQT